MGLINETNQSYYEGNDQGNYQYVSYATLVNTFIALFTGPGKVIPKVSQTEVQMHVKRGIQEFSYDVSRSYKGQEVEVPPTLIIPLPQDYVGWVGFSWIDSVGLKHDMYPLRISSNPPSILQDNNFNYLYDGGGALTYANEAEAWTRLKEDSGNSLDNQEDGLNLAAYRGIQQRFGLDPEFANQNGGFYIDEIEGMIHFTSHVNGKIVHIDYISDGLAYDSDMVIHKFAEDALYKYVLYAIISITAGAQEYLVRRYLKSYDAAKRKAKIRLSNYKAKMLTQIFRGKSKQIKH